MITMLFKHEFLRTWKLVLVAIGGGAVIAALGALGALWFPGPVGALTGVLGILVASVLPWAVTLGLGVDFYRSTYAKTGYLTAALPVKGSTIYGVKLAYAYLVTLLSLLVAVPLAAFAIAALLGLSGELTFAEAWAGIGEVGDVFVALPFWLQACVVLLVLLFPLSSLAQYWFAVTVGSESWINRLGLGGVVLTWFGYYVAAQVVAVVAVFIPPYLDITDPSDVHVFANPMLLFSEYSEGGVPVMAVVVGLVLAIAAIWGGKVSYDRRLELR